MVVYVEFYQYIGLVTLIDLHYNIAIQNIHTRHTRVW